MYKELFSIKIRTSKEGKHISGNERIVPKNKINETVFKLLERQKNKDFDFSNIKIEKLKVNPEIVEKTLKIETLFFSNYNEAKKYAIKLLNQIVNLPENQLESIIGLLYEGAAPDGSNMRGAMLVNTDGKRVEIDKFKGVRTVLVDYVDREKIEKKLLDNGFTTRTADALALTTKNMLHPKIIAEFCISDDPDYTTGYISTKDKYIRLSPLKLEGLNKGGRVYFIQSDVDLTDIYNFLQKTPVLIKDIDL